MHLLRCPPAPSHRPSLFLSLQCCDKRTFPSDHILLPHHWGDFPRQNALLRRLLYHEFPRSVLLDIAPPTALRPDLHASATDCLHYLTPGPVDTWVYYLFNALALVDALPPVPAA